jgi:hypothetical protein
VRAVAWLALLVAAAACGSSAARTTSVAAVTTTTTSAAIPSEQVAAAFFEAWKTGDREMMERLSEPAALAEADGLRDFSSEPWEPELCEGAAGTVHCIWVSDVGTLAIGVRNIEEPHLVTSFRMLNP